MNADDDPVLIAAYGRVVGRSLGALDPSHGARRPKQYRRSVVDAAVKAADPTVVVAWDRNRPRIKSVAVGDDLLPHEAVSFPAFTTDELLEESWDGSTFRREIESLLFLPIQGPGGLDDANQGILLEAVPWSPSATDDDAMRQEWERFREEIRTTGTYTSTATDTTRIHIRPHALDSDDLDPTSDGNVRNCFWLNKPFIQRILEDALG